MSFRNVPAYGLEKFSRMLNNGAQKSPSGDGTRLKSMQAKAAKVNKTNATEERDAQASGVCRGLF